MKNKQKAALRLLAALLALTLLAPLGLTASAADGPDTIYIDSASDFVSFAKSCALDTWSAGKTVILRADISLAGMDYTPVAAFGGTFDGGGHTISDLNLTGSYSPAGLFAVILSGGSVEDLNVAGSVAAAGDKIVAGGIAGENYGRIVCCSFTGMVQGSAQIGGIAGVNRVSGQIISSTFDGKVQATNATGGIAGLNEGIIRHCTNTGSINTNNVDASLSLSDIQIDTTLDLANLTTSQTFLTTTETGGIAGTNTGLIAGCKNTGTVGYEHVGYNIGGIAGSTSGYLRSNTNEGTILGRKDVGGIAGQVEPYVAVTVSESTKDQLQTQLQDLKTLTDRATADAGGAASSLGSQLAGMGTYLDGAANAANNLRATATIDAGALADGSVTGGADLTVGDASAGIGAAIGAGKDADLTIDTHPLEIGSSTSAGIGAGVGGFVDPSDLSLSGGTDGSGALSASLQMNADASMPELASALSGMGAQRRAIGSQAANLSTTLQNDVQAISDKLGEINDTVFAAMDELENRDLVTDGSQTDPDSITLGAVRACENTGTVQADRNVGGIAGAMGLEYSVDPESDVSQSLSSSERKQYELRALLQKLEKPTDDLAKFLKIFNIDISSFTELLKVINKIPGVFDSTRVAIGSPNRAGMYLVTAITSNPNYKTGVGTGTLVVKMRASGASLTWNNDKTTYTTSELASSPLGATLMRDGQAASNQEGVHYRYVGTTDTHRLYISSKAPTAPGTYRQTAYILGGNDMAKSISRSITITAD